MHRLIFAWLKEQWLNLSILAAFLVFINLCLYIGWKILGVPDSSLIGLVRDGIEMIHAFGGGGVHPDNLEASFLAVGWRHPIVVAMLAGYATARGSRSVATEIEEGRAELLFSLPYPRFVIVLLHFCSTLLGIALLTAALVFSSIVFGNLLGPEIAASNYIATGFVTVALYGVMAALAYFFSSFLRRGGWALNLSLLVILVLYAVNFAGNLGLFESYQKYTLFANYRVAESLGGITTLGGEALGFWGVTVVLLAISLMVTTIRDL
jgi:ABC-type transport system involved in multi-copper enzyme maturation permease subunit